MQLRELLPQEVTFELTCEPEQTAPNIESPEALQAVLDLIAKSGEWAWCRVTVAAKWKNLAGHDYRGRCCFHSEEYFKKSPFYENMKDGALSDLNKQIAQLAEDLTELEIKEQE